MHTKAKSLFALLSDVLASSSIDLMKSYFPVRFFGSHYGLFIRSMTMIEDEQIVFRLPSSLRRSDWLSQSISIIQLILNQRRTIDREMNVYTTRSVDLSLISHTCERRYSFVHRKTPCMSCSNKGVVSFFIIKSETR